MLIDSLPQLTYEQTTSIQWQGDPEQYDLELAGLANQYETCLVKNPYVSNPNWVYHIKEIPNETDRCLVFHYKDEWIAKIFFKGWTPDMGYKDIYIKSPQVIWRKNPDLDHSMTFEDSPFGQWEPDPWDVEYTMTWYMDPQFNPTEDKVWVMTCEVVGVKVKGTKDMGFLTPEVDIIYNDIVPALTVDLSGSFPAYWDLCYDCVYELDPKFTGQTEKLWLIKISPKFRKTRDWKWLGIISPQPKIIYNKQIGIIDFDRDITDINFSDFEYENHWMLHRDHLDQDQEDIWAVKILWIDDPSGIKVMGSVAAEPKLEINTDIDFEFDLDLIQDHSVNLREFTTMFEWYIDPGLTDKHKIWAVRKWIRSKDTIVDQGILPIKDVDHFDVFFIDYDEPNAEINWQRVLKFAPEAKRISGVKGLDHAHKAAASQSSTEMFWVVDADSYLSNDWRFDFKPSLFDRDCVFVWHSVNPVCNLEYGYGGVKLFPKSKVLNLKEWGTDLTLSLGDKLKVINRVSNETRFNSSEFHTWRSAFREVAKLSQFESATSDDRIKKWLHPNTDMDFADWAQRGSRDALTWVKKNDVNLVNDYTYLLDYFKKNYE